MCCSQILQESKPFGLVGKRDINIKMRMQCNQDLARNLDMLSTEASILTRYVYIW